MSGCLFVGVVFRVVLWLWGEESERGGGGDERGEKKFGLFLHDVPYKEVLGGFEIDFNFLRGDERSGKRAMA